MSGERAATWRGASMKHLSLITLTFQNSALILILHYSRVMPLVDGYRYHTSTSVLINEIMKLGISATMALYDMSTKTPSNVPATTLLGNLLSGIVTGESWKLAVPAALYTLQNTLQYVAVSNLDPSTFQVTYQLKILTTAIFSVLLLGRRLSIRKWGALVLLIIGIVFVQLPQQEPEATVEGLKDPEKRLVHRSLQHIGSITSRAAGSFLTARSATYESRDETANAQHPQMNRSVGLIAVLISCALSGLAGVIFEKILKESSSKASTSLWMRNCQLSFWSLFPALFIGVIWVDGENIAKTGFFAGYNWVVWTAISFQAMGGIIVALVINYADNIAKNFATSISIIISTLASAYFFDFRITLMYFIGTMIVMASTYLYSQPEPAPESKSTDTELQDSTTYRDAPHLQVTVTSPVQNDGATASPPDSPTSERNHLLKRDA